MRTRWLAKLPCHINNLWLVYCSFMLSRKCLSIIFCFWAAIWNWAQGREISDFYLNSDFFFSLPCRQKIQYFSLNEVNYILLFTSVLTVLHKGQNSTASNASSLVSLLVHTKSIHGAIWNIKKHFRKDLILLKRYDHACFGIALYKHCLLLFLLNNNG